MEKMPKLESLVLDALRSAPNPAMLVDIIKRLPTNGDADLRDRDRVLVALGSLWAKELVTIHDDWKHYSLRQNPNPDR